MRESACAFEANHACADAAERKGNLIQVCAGVFDVVSARLASTSCASSSRGHRPTLCSLCDAAKGADRSHGRSGPFEELSAGDGGTSVIVVPEILVGRG